MKIQLLLALSPLLLPFSAARPAGPAGEFAGPEGRLAVPEGKLTSPESKLAGKVRFEGDPNKVHFIAVGTGFYCYAYKLYTGSDGLTYFDPCQPWRLIHHPSPQLVEFIQNGYFPALNQIPNTNLPPKKRNRVTWRCQAKRQRIAAPPATDLNDVEQAAQMLKRLSARGRVCPKTPPSYSDL